MKQQEAKAKAFGGRQCQESNAQERKDKEKRTRERKEREILEKADAYRRHKSRTMAELEKEWTFSLLHMYENDASKTFRCMSLKYHPDKCDDHVPGDDQLQKYLGQLRDKWMA